jgi:pimeloyl-ACP methyl ester carboxylesterase
MLGCRIAEEILGTDEHFAPLEDAPCPVTIAWCELDRLFPEGEFGPRARERVPGARYVVLRNVGHVPMLDDPQLVAAVIRESLARPRRPQPRRPAVRSGEVEEGA